MTARRALLCPRLSDAALAERAAPYRADLAAASVPHMRNAREGET